MSGVFVKYGAGNETRTRDPDLGKVVLYQLSYSRKKHPLRDSNICYKQKRHSLSGVFVKYGAGNETRTRDPDLGKVVLYQLSYSRKWRPLGDSNPCYRRERAVS
ncbi:hypothetical protein EMIT0194P_210021 [Pseudomonas serbica]|jgi:hypothetical protein